MAKSNDRIPDTGYWQRRAKDILSALEAPSERKERLPRYERVDPTVRMEPVVIKEKNAITDPDSWLNRGLANLGENAVEAILGEGTGSAGADMVLGLTGPGAAVGTVAAGNRPGVLDVLPGGSVMKAGLIGLLKAGKQAEAKTIYNILRNPIANRFANRYPEEALQSLEKFVKKHPDLKNMNTAEVYDAMGSGRLGGEWFVDLGKDYPEAFKLIHSTTEPIYHMNTGGYLSQREMADYLGDIFGKEYSEPLHRMMDEVDALVERGDYADATSRLSTLGQTMISMSEIPKDGFYRQFKTGEAFEKKLKEAAALPLSIREETAPVVRLDPKTASQSQKDAGDLVNEYIHLQMDPMDNWSRIADIDDKVAADIAQYGSVQAAEKARQAEQARIAMERKAAAEAAKESRQYEQRLRDFKKNPKKALKTANSAAPKQVRAQGESAVREWYFGVDPMASNAAKATPSQEILNVVDEPAKTAPVAPVTPVAPVPPPEPVAPVAAEVPKGGPNKWRENGWKSEDHPLSNGLTYDELVGRGASEEDRRASFVLDSLMNEAVGKLYATGAKWGADGKFYKKGNVPPGVKTVEPSYADYRHKGTNYDAVRLGLARDLEKNAITGNMPVSSKVILEQAYNTRSGNRIPGAKVLRINGMDTYENLFRPRVKDRLKELEEYYNIDFMR